MRSSFFCPFILFFVQPSLCEIFSINDRNYPHLFINDPVTAPVIWHKKSIGFRLANTAAVRINARGIRFIPGSHTLLLPSLGPQAKSTAKEETDDEKLVRQVARLWWNDTLSDEEIEAQRNALDRTKWRSITCKPSRECLCILSSSTNSNNNVRSRFFPNYPNQVFLSQRDSALLPMDIARMLGGSHCPETSTGRTAIAPQLASDVQQHDISLCNVLGLGADYIYVPYNNRLYVLTNPIDNALLVLMSIFVVYLMVVMGHNLQVVLNVNKLTTSPPPPPAQSTTDDKDRKNDSKAKRIHRRRRKSQARWAVVCMASLLLIACFASGASNILGAFVTQQDQVVFIATLVHIAYYCIRVEANVYLGDGRRANPINPMMAAIAAAVQRVYASAENPYSQTIFFIMLTWVLHKISMLNRKTLWPFLEENDSSIMTAAPWWRCADILADCILISIMMYAGVAGQVLKMLQCLFGFIQQFDLVSDHC